MVTGYIVLPGTGTPGYEFRDKQFEEGWTDAIAF